MKNLVIVESPAKAKTIENYLGKNYKVLSSVGHIRDLPKSKLGILTEDGFELEYTTLKGKGAVVSRLKKAMPEKGVVYLAQDLDREGEAIAWHVGQALSLFDKDGNSKKVRGKDVHYERIVFNEITKDAIQKAVAEPRKIDMSLINAQQARRALDRLVGYKLSPLLWKKIRYGLSAGRVQSVAMRLIVDRERERNIFVPEEFWTIEALLKKSGADSKPFELVEYKGKQIKLTSEKTTDEVIGKVSRSKDWNIVSAERKKIKKNPPAPFTTSTLQQKAYNKLKFTSKKTMGIAQKLYQGVGAGKNDKTVALITYMRTDSTNLSKQAVKSIRDYVSNDLGKDLLESTPRVYKKKVKSAQEAHEAIRPTDITITPEKASKFLQADELKLYDLIWKRTVATQMVSAEYVRVKIDVDCEDYLFRNSHQSLIKPGYLSLYSRSEEDLKNLEYAKGELLILDGIEKEQHFTQPPARYNEASLVKALESYGVGRPSTYSSIISTILARGYVSKESGYFKPEDTGIVVTDLLVKHFPQIVDLDFTSTMEDNLDEIANGEKEWIPVVKEFYGPFEKLLLKKEKEIKKEDVVILGKSDETCDICGKEMVIKLGRYGRFLSCPDFPDCKGIKSILVEDPEELAEKYEPAKKCPDCGADMVMKMGRYGRFWACENYPKCKGVASLILKEKCPECGKGLVERKGRWGKTFIGCSGYPDCRYIKKNKKQS